ncbi:glycoside hydrolase family 78 protein [Actinocorallia libanotica]|uniref:alpha-L-rhamnosidase n=2 Tax=Actinocorallia libanotica TaxID=46162 RepID=A0ABP4BY71_9ACTN
MKVAGLRFEQVREPLGVGTARPRLSWRTETETPGWVQTAYEVEARGERVRVESADSVLVPWPFAPLESRERVMVAVRVTGSSGGPSPWTSAEVEAGLLRTGDWEAEFVGPGEGSLLRTEFESGPGLVSARLYATALGVYEAELNGERIGDHVLAPGWTSYRHRLRYQTYDVTGLVREGANCLGATLGDGWYRGRLGYEGKRALYGDRTALLAQLELAYEDGTVRRIATAPSTWRASSGALLSSDLYDGEAYDARKEQEGWSEPGFDDSAWWPAEPVEGDLGTLVAPTGPPVRVTETLEPVAALTSPSGKTILDFGQNLVGKLRITVSGEAGEEVTLRHAEILQDGELCVEPLRTAKATDTYILRGGEDETWEPRFTFHGFRYAEIAGPVIGAVALVCHSDLERTGWFACSDPLVERLHENAVWGMRGNFLDVPTDCPQRDERLGWTGDLQVFAPTASFLYDSAGFLRSWLADLAAEQGPDGEVPSVVPAVSKTATAAAWGDAAVIVPWTLYQRYGDIGVLEEQFSSMRGWVDHVEALAGEDLIWNSGFQYGDWLDPTAPPGRPEAAKTFPEIVATAYFAHSAELVAEAARLLGRAEDAEHYQALSGRVRQVFRDEYVTPSGRLLSDSQTAYALALRFGLLPEGEQRRHAAARLADLVRAGGYRIATGFVGTPLICDALAEGGFLDQAYHLLLQKECPSWLYTVVQGATTIWERWDSLMPDGRVNPSGMTSFNHYAFGAVSDWLHRTVAGLAPAAPGYRRLRMAPRPGGGLTHASARLRTPYGEAACGWRLNGDRLSVEATVPANVSAEVSLPDGTERTVGSGAHRWDVPFSVAATGPLTLDSTLGEVADRPGGLKLVADVIVARRPEFAEFIEIGLGSVAPATRLRDGLAMIPDAGPILRDVEAALAGL